MIYNNGISPITNLYDILYFKIVKAFPIYRKTLLQKIYDSI